MSNITQVNSAPIKNGCILLEANPELTSETSPELDEREIIIS